MELDDLLILPFQTICPEPELGKNRLPPVVPGLNVIGQAKALDDFFEEHPAQDVDHELVAALAALDRDLPDGAAS